MASRLKELVGKVFVATLGAAPYVQAQVTEMAKKRRPDTRMIQRLTDQPYYPFFTARFKDGFVRGVTPSPKDPTKFLSQLVATGEDTWKVIFPDGREEELVLDPKLSNQNVIYGSQKAHSESA